MFVLHSEHTVASFDAWKSVFDSHPHDRTQTGAQRYRILRPKDNPNAVIVEVEFATVGEAEAVLADLRTSWIRMQGSVLTANPKVQIAEIVQSVEL
jgi:membrane protein required for beta-lactamase induction